MRGPPATDEDRSPRAPLAVSAPSRVPHGPPSPALLAPLTPPSLQARRHRRHRLYPRLHVCLIRHHRRRRSHRSTPSLTGSALSRVPVNRHHRRNVEAARGVRAFTWRHRRRPSIDEIKPARPALPQIVIAGAPFAPAVTDRRATGDLHALQALAHHSSGKRSRLRRRPRARPSVISFPASRATVCATVVAPGTNCAIGKHRAQPQPRPASSLHSG